jgi:hypothetical protein
MDEELLEVLQSLRATLQHHTKAKKDLTDAIWALDKDVEYIKAKLILWKVSESEMKIFYETVNRLVGENLKK